MIIAPASSWKTELLKALAARGDAYLVSSITDKTFASGMRRENNNQANTGREPSLLLRLKKRGVSLLAFTDFGTISTLSWEKRQQIYAQLREVYEGQFRATSGTCEEVDWSGKLAIMTAATPDVDRQGGLRTTLGERLVQYRPKSGEPVRVALRAQLIAAMPEGRKRTESDLESAYAEAFEAALRAARAEPGPEAAAMHLRASALAQLLADARREAHRPGGACGSSHEVAEPEGPARLTKTFEALGRAASACFGGDVEKALHLPLRFALDSVKPGHRRLLMELASKPLTARAGSELLDCDDDTARRHLDDLALIGLGSKKNVGGTNL